MWGPGHTNDKINIYPSPSPAAWFHNQVVTAKTISNKTNARFDQGYIENGPVIPMPSTADLNKLKTQAQAGLTAITGNTSGSYGEATTRIEFIAVDLNSDGQVTGPNEGFMRVYQAKSTSLAWWVAGTFKGGLQYASESSKNPPDL